MRQAELEREIVQGGRSRCERMMEKNEEAGRAYNNPYAQAINRRFVLPLAALIREDLTTIRPGARKAHVALLSPIDPEAVAFIAVRSILSHLLGGGEQGGGNSLMHSIGSSVYHEYMLNHFDHVAPELFYKLVHDFERRRSKNERHKMTVFKMQARASGIEWNEWGIGAKEQVGAYLIDQLSALGMVEVTKTQRRHGRHFRSDTLVSLTEDTTDSIASIKDFIAETTPYYMPCVEQPRDWKTISDGGWHTDALRRIMPYAISVRKGDITAFEDVQMQPVLDAINTLQRVQWRINSKMLDTVRVVAKHFDMEEILGQSEIPRPERPAFLESGMTKEQMLPEQLHEFARWRRSMAEWHTEMRLRGAKYGRFYTATRVADKFRDEPHLHFVYFADFRGRFYAQTTGINPQGSDLQRALLRFSIGKPLLTDDAVRWFLVNGANKFGFDKAPLKERAAWVMARKDMICRMADDPISFSEWREADKPLQFLAWAFEFREWVRNPNTFVSHLPVAMDGSCNGLQNFSALLRDEVGGKATNLLSGKQANDIYTLVAERTTALLSALPDDDNGYKQRWLLHGITRSLVKRSVMTLPYGSTRFSCADFIVGDYLAKGKATEFSRDEYDRAARYLSFPVWQAIGDVVVKAREAMGWLQQVASLLIRSGEQSIRWYAPTGFPVLQQYWEVNEHRINTKLCGNTKIVCYSETDDPSRSKHRNGIAPNFVHSLDAAHMTLTTVAAGKAGITSLAMIHDDYGTHAADAQAMYHIIREVFVDMYSTHSPLDDLRNRYAAYGLPPTPQQGNLDIREVLSSEFFFS